MLLIIIIIIVIITIVYVVYYYDNKLLACTVVYQLKIVCLFCCHHSVLSVQCSVVRIPGVEVVEVITLQGHMFLW